MGHHSYIFQIEGFAFGDIREVTVTIIFKEQMYGVHAVDTGYTSASYKKILISISVKIIWGDYGDIVFRTGDGVVDLGEFSTSIIDINPVFM